MPLPREISDLRNRFGFSEIECAALIHGRPEDWKAYEDGRKTMHPAFWELFRLKTGHSLPTSFDINEAVKVSVTTPDGRQWLKLKRVEKWKYNAANSWPDKFREIGDGEQTVALYLYEKQAATVRGSRKRWAYPWKIMGIGDIAMFQVSNRTEQSTVQSSLSIADIGTAEFKGSLADIPGRGTVVVYERVL